MYGIFQIIHINFLQLDPYIGDFQLPAIMTIIMFGLTMCLAILGSVALSQQIVLAQQNATLSTTSSTINYTKMFSENKGFQKCYDFMPDECIPTVDILYQSPKTIALKSDYIDAVWKAVDEIKKDGYKIDDITSYSVTSGFGSSTSNYVNLLVVMSK